MVFCVINNRNYSGVLDQIKIKQYHNGCVVRFNDEPYQSSTISLQTISKIKTNFLSFHVY